jgi:alkylhydroperoxidase/carboxymuconolactone decarboxylase family protein YurZ
MRPGIACATVGATNGSEAAMEHYKEVLHNLVINDRRLLARLNGPEPADRVCTLDDKTSALVRVASLVATDGPAETFRWTVGDALAAGADENEVVAVLLSVAGLVGVAKAGAAARKVALALDYDLDASLERYEPHEA